MQSKAFDKSVKSAPKYFPLLTAEFHFSSLGKVTLIKTAINSCSLLAKYTFCELVGKRPSSLIMNFEQVIKHFLVYFTFFLRVVDCTFYKSTI